MTDRTLVADGPTLSIEASPMGRGQVRIRAWHRQTDELRLLDCAKLISAKERERLTEAIPEALRPEAAQLLEMLAAELFDLEAERSQGTYPSDSAATVQPPSAEDLFAQCRTLARTSAILDAVAAELKQAGVVGVDRLVKLLFLALVSRLLPRPVSLAIKGPSAAGKSFPVEQVLRLFPASAYYALTAFSERALAYGSEPLVHRILILYEAGGMAGDMQSYLVRSLLSEGCVKYETVEKGEDGTLRSRLIERPGPTGLITTTTKPSLHPENETRLVSITVSDTPDQTRAVLRAIASRTVPRPGTESWHALQLWLETRPTVVSIPYATALAGLVSPAAVRVRRDFSTLLSLVSAHALLHQANRATDSDGRIVATLDDYGVVRELVAELFAEGTEASVASTVRETVDVVRDLLSGRESESRVTASEVGVRLGLDRSAALRRVRTAVDRGYLVNEEDRRGRPARLRLGDPLPGDADTLPTVEQVESGCTVVGETEGFPRGDAWEPPEAST